MFAREMMRGSTSLPPRSLVRQFDWQKLVKDVREARRRTTLRDDVDLRRWAPPDDWRRLAPVSRFRAVVRLVLANLAWLGVADEDDEGTAAALLPIADDADSPGPLTPEEKAILQRPAHVRTDAERAALHRAVGRLNCFRRYPEDVQRQLAENTYYVLYGPGRVLVRQGDEAQALYFVVSGEVKVTVSHWDEVKQIMVEQEAPESFGPGDVFGEVSLLHGIPRTATCTTRTSCELLYLVRDDFARVLRATLQREWEQCERSMVMFPYFDGWDVVAMRECCILSRTARYRDDELVLGDGAGLPEHVHFVTEGELRLVQHLDLETRQRERAGAERVFLQVCLLRVGAVFNLGESLERRRVLAAGVARCLLVPRAALLERDPHLWTEVRQVLQHTVPSHSFVDQHYLRHRHWLQYRRRLVEQAVSRRRLPTAAALHDVPISIRLHSEDMLRHIPPPSPSLL